MKKGQINHSIFRGGLYLSLAWFFLTLVNLFSRIVYPQANTWMMLLMLSLVGWICLLPHTAKHKLKIHTWGPLFVRIICFLLSYICTFIAIEKKMSLGDIMVLDNTAPIFLPFVMWIWLRKKIKARLWTGILLGFGGVLLVLKPTPALLHESGPVFALIAGILYAISMVALRLLGKKETALSVLFYFFLFSMILSIPAVLMTWQPISWKTLFGLMGLGVCSYLGQICFLKAFTWARPIEINPLNYTGVIFSYIAGWLFWREKIDAIGLFGIVLIIGGSCLTFYLDRQSNASTMK